MQALTAIAIILDVPLARQILGFLCFIPLMGMVTMPLIKVKCTSRSEFLIYACGLGIVMMMILGLLVNSLYPLINKPLSLAPMLIALNLYMLAALFLGVAFKRDVPYQFEKAPMQPGTIKYMLVISLLPAMAILGTWAMNVYGFNLILMLMILAIAIVFLAVLLDKQVPDGIYPLLVLASSLSLLLLYSMRSFYLIGFDVHGEYYAFQLALANYHWSLGDYLHIYNTCLSITILPTVLYSLLNIDPQYLFKLVFQVAFALMPLGVYLFFKEKIDKRLAFLAAFFMMSHYMFIYQMASLVRQEVALLFFVLAIYVLFTDRIKTGSGVALFLAFSFGTVVSHYTTAFLFLFLLLATYLATRYVAAFKIEGEHRITAPLVLALLAMVLFWHGLVSRITLSAAIGYGVNTLESINNILEGVGSQKAPMASMIMGQGIDVSLPNILSFVIGSLCRAAVVLGVLYIAYLTLFVRPKANTGKGEWSSFDTEYVFASLVLVSLVVLSILVPFMSVGYNIERLYMQALVFLAPLSIVGALIFFNRIRVPRETAVTCIGLVVAMFLLCQTGLLYQAFGMPGSISLNPGDNSGYLVRPEEVAGAQWLAANESPAHVYADNYGTLRLWSYGEIPRGYGYDRGAYSLNSQGYDFRGTRYDLLNSYVYLDYYNIKDGVVSGGWGVGQTPLSYFGYLERLDQVYDNGGSEILKKSGRGL